MVGARRRMPSEWRSEERRGGRSDGTRVDGDATRKLKVCRRSGSKKYFFNIKAKSRMCSAYMHCAVPDHGMIVLSIVSECPRYLCKLSLGLTIRSAFLRCVIKQLPCTVDVAAETAHLFTDLSIYVHIVQVDPKFSELHWWPSSRWKWEGLWMQG